MVSSCTKEQKNKQTLSMLNYSGNFDKLQPSQIIYTMSCTINWYWRPLSLGRAARQSRHTVEDLENRTAEKYMSTSVNIFTIPAESFKITDIE